MGQGYGMSSRLDWKAQVRIESINCLGGGGGGGLLTPSLRRPFKHTIFFRPPVGQRVNTLSVFESFAGSRVNTPLVAVTNVG